MKFDRQLFSLGFKVMMDDILNRRITTDMMLGLLLK
jgi:hypothetical protein